MNLLTLILAQKFALLAAHKFAAGVIAWGVFSSIVDGMPAPVPTSGMAYRWLYATLNALAVNLFTAISAFFPHIAALFARKSPDSKEQSQ